MRPENVNCLSFFTENYQRPATRPVVRTEDKSRLSHTASRSPADDILTRWRLQRKMEEATAAVSSGQRGRLSSAKHSKVLLGDLIAYLHSLHEHHHLLNHHHLLHGSGLQQMSASFFPQLSNALISQKRRKLGFRT